MEFIKYSNCKLNIINYLQIKLNKMKDRMDKQKKQQKQRNIGIAMIQNALHQYINNTQQSKYCLCQVCMQNYQILQKGRQLVRQSSSMFKTQIAKLKKFYYFISSVDNKISFKLQIPQLVFFEGGQGKVLFKNKIGTVNMVQLTPDLRKQIPNFFIDSKKNNLMLKKSISDNQPNHIKFFQSVIPSLKHGLSNDNPLNRPKNYTFHSNQKQTQDPQLSKAHHLAASSEVAIVKYKDRGPQLVNQKQLRAMLKNGPFKTLSIEVIQSYIRPYQKQSQFIFSEYIQVRKPSNTLMFNRSLIQMKTQIGLLSNFSKQYVPIQYLQQYEQMLKQMPQQYGLYQTYKMVHYIQINRDVKVKHLTTVWFRDQFKQLSFFGVSQFDYDLNQIIQQQILPPPQANKKPLTNLQKQLLSLWQDMKKKKKILKQNKKQQKLN